MHIITSLNRHVNNNRAVLHVFYVKSIQLFLETE